MIIDDPELGKIEVDFKEDMTEQEEKEQARKLQERIDEAQPL